MSSIPVDQLRQCIIDALPLDVAHHGGQIPVNQIYLPWTHTKALRLENSLVIGGRGVGKSVWSKALQESSSLQESGVLPKTLFPYPLEVSPGFGTGMDPRYPDPDTFETLLQKGIPPYAVWRAVLCRSLGNLTSQSIPRGDWESTVRWVLSQPEEVANLIRLADQACHQNKCGLLLVFDALDRVSSSGQWNQVDQAIRDLLRLVLLLRGTRRLHCKVFLRTDQYERGNFADIPDVSKLQSTRVDLIWSATDLHGLLWQLITNGPLIPARDLFRSWCRQESGSAHEGTKITHFVESGIDRWPLPQSLQRDQLAQRRLFEKLAGPWMGKDLRRGVPYIWIVNHLADGQGQTTPRSFQEGIRKAAEDSQRYLDYPLALHYESLKRGVQAASEIRINELAEDHPWVRALMDPLAGISVPCSTKVFEERWQAEFGSIPDAVPGLPERMPDVSRRLGFIGVIGYLLQLGLIAFMRDGRINMPDLYRVGFRLGRKGGVKPALRTSQGT